MKSVINTITLLASASLFSAVAQATCHADNCYRALFPCASPAAVSSAVDFCLTLTAVKASTTTTPTRAVSACGTDPARYSSACACGPTCPTTIATSTSTSCPSPTPAGNVVPNGDFECGIAPWTPEVPDSAATWTLSSPGATGSFAFEADLLGVPVSPELGVSVRVTSAAFAVTPGVVYTLTFNSWFDDLLSGFIGVMVNGSPIYTVDATDKGAGAWHLNTVSYTPTAASVNLRFEFLFGTQHEPGVQRVDTVFFSPA
ncbi:hypothetical protein CONLIGDRAFT_699440 [Coniochaeta ligniaria NRRL 30616]|uniref:CBM-cenC domain-containing protein n=1 Tax=Coniochaeta ligniaria NRRL 30616 TaxID=1408157 RepID=A0A1J7JGY2_9PEZI|nr:hypothetical protein CONLIGDRAFT_699440 [Coniochaeta ligniaria NRRL 30616]